MDRRGGASEECEERREEERNERELGWDEKEERRTIHPAQVSAPVVWVRELV
jgi:hypothetical protein